VRHDRRIPNTSGEKKVGRVRTVQKTRVGPYTDLGLDGGGLRGSCKRNGRFQRLGNNSGGGIIPWVAFEKRIGEVF